MVSHAVPPTGIYSSIRSKRYMVSSSVYPLLPVLRPPPCLNLPCLFFDTAGAAIAGALAGALIPLGVPAKSIGNPPCGRCEKFVWVGINVS